MNRVTSPIPRELLEWVERDSELGQIPSARREAFRYLNEHAHELVEQFPGEYVAATSDGVRAHSTSWVQAYMKLREMGISWDVAAVRYFPGPDERLSEILECS